MTVVVASDLPVIAGCMLLGPCDHVWVIVEYPWSFKQGQDLLQVAHSGVLDEASVVRRCSKTRIDGAYLDKECGVQLATMEGCHSWRWYCIMQPENQDEVEVRQE